VFGGNPQFAVKPELCPSEQKPIFVSKAKFGSAMMRQESLNAGIIRFWNEAGSHQDGSRRQGADG
jgi:hypothetical protein